MDEEKIKLLASVAAMKLLLGRLYSLVYIFAKLKPEQILDVHRRLLEQLPKQSLVQTNDAAVSDLMSAEVEVEIQRFLLGVEKEVGAQPKAP